MHTHRALGVLLLVLAGLLVANPLYVYQHPDEVYYVQAGTSFEGDPGSLTANYTYEDLSPRAQELVTRAIESESRISFHGDHRRPDDFQFTADGNETVEVVGGVYRIEYQGETHYVRTSIAPPSNNESNRSQGLITLGVLLGLTGLVYANRDLPVNLGVSLAALGGLLLLLNVKSRFAPDLLSGLNVFGSQVFLMLGIVIAIASVGYLVFRINRERRLEAS
jgi:hypothetical protein